MKHLRHVLLVMGVLALVTLACALGRRGATTQPEPPAQATQVPVEPASTPETMEADTPTPTQVPVTEEATQVPPQDTQAGSQEEPLDLESSIAGLEELNSYRASFRFDWAGTKDGQPVEGFMEMQSAFVREPAAQELHFEGQGFAQGENQGMGKVSFIQVGNTAWFYESESDTWTQVPAGSLDFAEGLFFQPEDLLRDFDVAEAQRSQSPQEVNGVQTYKYTFDETDLGLASLSAGEEVKRAEGEAYVAVDGEYVVKLIIDADLIYTDPEEMFEEGNVSMTFDITDINRPITIEPPAEAAAQTRGREDLPLLPDADIEFSSAEFISFRTGTGVKEAAQFYESEMPKQGWSADETNMILDENAILNYNKDGETAGIIIGADENGTNVLITIGKE